VDGPRPNREGGRGETFCKEDTRAWQTLSTSLKWVSREGKGLTGKRRRTLAQEKEKPYLNGGGVTLLVKKIVFLILSHPRREEVEKILERRRASLRSEK